jgi:alpha-tubulin suppressor-like RCC1 family protein
MPILSGRAMSDDYHDDPVEEPVVKRKKPRAIFGSALLLFAGGLFLNTTLAANINIGTGGKVEFGQGIAITTACSGSSVLTATPSSSFANTSRAGDFYLSSVTVSGIPSSCHGDYFQISVYDSTTSTALPIFDGNKNVATVYNNAGSFEQGFLSPGMEVSGASGTFTVTFKPPVALSSTAMRLTLQSSEQRDWAQAAISSGFDYSCTLLNSSAVKCWGANQYGNLGDGTTTQRLTPVTVSGLGSRVSSIAVGNRHACAVLSYGAVKCWGTNNFGQVGTGATGADVSTPFTVPGLSGVSAMSVGAHFSCALLKTGAVKCWGRGAHVGDGTSSNRLTPVDVVGLSSGVIAIASGNYHTCAVLNTGAVRCWGQDGRGAVGNGGGGNSPGTVTGLSASAIGIVGGDRHTCALLSTGGVQCWGWNDQGALGNGLTGDNSTPQTVIGISSAVALGAGGEFSCAILSSGAAKCWGANANGQLGDGTTTRSLTPVDVSGLSSAVAIANGYTHTCALLSSGEAKCWGSNGNGRLGNGTTTNSFTPVSVTGIP